MAKIKAELITNMGDDLLVVNSARVSFDKEHEEFCEGKDEKLIKYLAKHNHWTPFSHNRFTFKFSPKYLKGEISVEDKAGMVCKVEGGKLKIRHSFWGWANLINSGKIVGIAASTISRRLSGRMPYSSEAVGLSWELGQDFCGKEIERIHGFEESDPDYIDVTLRETVPIFVARQRFKHMVGFTYNEVSRRYVDDEPTFYVPDSWRSRPDGSVKQGSGEPINHFDGWQPSSTKEALKDYEYLLDSGIAPEQARMVLPQSMMTSYYTTGSLAAFARMVKQRKDPHAQKEIQDLAHMVDDIIRPLYPVSWSALVDD